MPHVTFLSFAGLTSTVEVPSGVSVMRAAVDHGVAGIDGDCGGQCACATCHVFVEAPWRERVGPRTSREDEMLNFASELRDGSRLACQIVMTDALEGLVVQLPRAQH